MPDAALLASIQVGTPHAYGKRWARNPMDRAWTTSFFRSPSPEPRRLFRTHLEGNEQADTKNHGRLDQAVLLYAAQHYPLWQAELRRSDIGPGGFGENFTVHGLSEGTACIGDVYAIGDALIEVSGPRFPCWKIERRWRIDGLTARVAENGRTGWYCRVVREGTVQPGMPIHIEERPFPQWTVALVNDFGHFRASDLALARDLATCPALNPFWSELVVRRAPSQE